MRVTLDTARTAGRAAQRARALTAAEAHLRTALQLSLSGNASAAPSPDTIVCMNDLAGVLLERRLKMAAHGASTALDVTEVEALTLACLTSLQTLGYTASHSAVQSAQRNLVVVRGYAAAGARVDGTGGGENAEAPPSEATEAPLAQVTTAAAGDSSAAAAAAAAVAAAAAAVPVAAAPVAAAPDSHAQLRALNGAWLIDEGVSQNTGALLTYFGAPWLLVQAVLASPTPPLHLALTSDCAALRVTYPGLFPLVNSYTLGGPSFHRSPFGGQQAAAFSLGVEDAGAGGPALVLEIPQAPALGLMRITHALRSDGRQWVIVRMLVGGAEKLRITRVYDRAGPVPQ